MTRFLQAVRVPTLLTLSLAIAATTTMFSVVDAALLRPVPFSEPDTIAMLYVTRTTPQEGTVRLRWSRPVISAMVAALSDGVWHQRFHSDPDIVGKTVRVNDVPLTIVGVLPAGFAGITGRSVIWIPRVMAPQLTYADYLVTPQHFISVVAR